MSALTPAEKYAKAKKRKFFPITVAFSENYAFELDDFQIRACHAIENGRGALVAAPTGSGKTIVGEFAIYKAISEGKKCFYTTPIKALSNQKFNDLVSIYGPEKIGLLTGDTSINGSAQVVVMTTEVLRNMIYVRSSTLEDLGYVVMDEVHYLADKFRGAVWEEILIHLPPDIQVISLSATVSNLEEFGDWLTTVRGSTEVVVSEKRPVPLYQHVLVGNRLMDLFESEGRINRELLKAERRQLSVHGFDKHRNKRFMDRSDLLRKLDGEGFLPAIFFIFSRAGCDAAATRALKDGVVLTSLAEQKLISEYVMAKTAHLPPEDLSVLDFHQWVEALERGIATHHAGLLPLFKEITEGLFQQGLIKIVFATETLALGINMPARTVILDKLTKWNGEAHVSISPGEYTQLTGRAGRRGIDVEGNSIIMWSPAIDAAMAASLAGARTYPLKSSFAPTYNMSANLISRMSQARAKESLSLSFAQYQATLSVAPAKHQIAMNQVALSNIKIECHLGDFESYFTIRKEIRDLEKTGVPSSVRNRHKYLEERSEKILTLRSALKKHSAHACPKREEHARDAEKRDRLQRETEKLERKVESISSLVPKTFERVVELLSELGYVEAGRLSSVGRLILKIFAESDLLLAEAIRKEIFDSCTPDQLPTLLSGILFEGRRDERQIPRLPKQIEPKVREIAVLWNRIASMEEERGIRTQREPDYSMCWNVHRWSNGATIATIMRESDISVGDFVRHIKQIIDLLIQLREAAPGLSEKIERALELIDRGLIRYAAMNS